LDDVVYNGYMGLSQPGLEGSDGFTPDLALAAGIFVLTLGQDMSSGVNMDFSRLVTMLVRTLCFRLAMVFGLLLVLGAARGITPAVGANGLEIAIDPAEVSLPLGNQAPLNIIVRGGVNVNAFDVTVTYDAQHLSLTSWVHGGYLANLSCLYMVNEPGLFQLACTQLARPAVDGDGVLLALVFDTLAVGQTEVAITKAEFADPAGVKTYPERETGVVGVLDIPKYTVTPITSPTSTATPTMTVTQTEALTPTVSPTTTFTPEATWTATTPPTQTPPATATPLPTDLATEAAARTATAAEAQTATEAADEPQLRWPAGTATPEGGSEQRTQTAIAATATHLADPQLPAEDDPSTPSETGSQAWMARLLWGALALGVAAFLTVLILAIRQKNNQREDYLL
jgi:hypothetical protein